MARLPATSPASPAVREPGTRESKPAVRDRRAVSVDLDAKSSVIAYVEADAVGFDRLPPSVTAFLIREGLLSGKVIAASAIDPVAKRRKDRSMYQLASGWWSSNEGYLRISATRDLAPDSAGRYHPTSEWLVTGSLFLFPPRLRPTASTWQFSAARSPGADGQPEKSTVQVADDPLEVLPPGIASPVIGGSSDAWVEYERGFARETVVAARELEGRVRCLRATREASSRRALEKAPWRIITLDAPVVAARHFGQVALASAPMTRLSTGRTPEALHV